MTTWADSLPPPRKTVNYYTADDPKGGALFIYGDADAAEIAIFCPGYADDHDVFMNFCHNLAEKNKTLVGLMCIPGFDDRPDKPWTTHKKGGYTFDEMAAAVRDAVKALRIESTVENAKLTGFFHDWGVMPGLMWANITLEQEDTQLSPDQLVLFDVLPPVHPSLKDDLPDHKPTTLREKITTSIYRVLLALAFAIQLYVSKYIALIVFGFGFTILGILGLAPVLQIDIDTIQARKPPLDPHRMIYMAYPYLLMFTSRKVLLANSFLCKDLKKTPILYLYGTVKNMMFHDDGAVKYLERETKENRGKSNAIAIDNAGHYLYLQQPDKCLEEVMKFMAK
mmetsp:Transcript_9300/g.13832  ORF Transcript_9300/g.13832 Transcript_9300/m.13832 type:complete len:338 (+) Transcript_9300:74-1087(+)|eukprot:CAMPEP_0203663374 /NCGR_PEP_ID=MMETSP0090-20130426/971_1 /ASSEMBLY_ACC=CAM_ASM_001088 /TAXON_ID=426623 /ORGANISM="Chaetoceros affinis, Strain CCMP159" /LENGTH=337 /DNA_ID=CAMNT_0050526265 /DNA_START=46 /DNA_END=1059 /DNA_ORIENTATION=+